jgi:DNA invertase Pin-like site-specific DNA recombinase
MVLILFNVLISFAQFEREVTREQIRGTTLLIQNKFHEDKTLFS